MTAGRTLAGTVALLLAAGGAACARRAWDSAALVARHPELHAGEARSLVDLHPYVWARAGRVALFTCRWTTDAPIGVHVSAGLDEPARQAVETALRAWQGAGLGVRFEPVRADEAQLEIALREGPVELAEGTGSGVTVADCALPADAPPAAGAVLAAELVAARVELALELGPDVLGRSRAASPAELAGAALHELGHALGFQGHVRGSGVMARTPEVLRAFGARVLAGEPLDAPALRALYALPSGSVLAAAAAEAWRTDLVDRMATLAGRVHLDGPFARSGDRTARLFWRDPARGDEYGLQVVNLGDSYADPGRVLLVPEPNVRRALPRSRDRAR